MNISYDELFPVLIATCRDVITPLQIANIYEYLISRSDTVVHPAIDGPSRSQHSYNNQNSNILKDISHDVSGCTDLYNNIHTLANEYAHALNIHECNIINSLFNVQGKGSSVLKHIHASARNPCTISAISFENPNPFNLLYTPKTPTGPRKYICHSMSQVPSDGTLIIFPSWLSHSVTPSVIDNRVVISFNAG